MSRRLLSWMITAGLGLAAGPLLANPFHPDELDRAYYAAWGVDPDDPISNALLGSQRLEERQWHSAAAHFEVALREDPSQYDTRVGYGEALIGLGRHEDAERALRPVVGTGTEAEGRAHTLLGLLASQRDERSTALGHYQRVVELKPDLAPPRFNLGISLIRNGRRADGVDQLQKAVELDPEMVPARRRLATGLAELGRNEEALVHLDLLIEASPNDPVALFKLGHAQKALGNPQLGRKSLERSLAIARQSTRYQKLVDRIESELATPDP